MMNNLRRVSCLLALSSNLYTPSSASPSQLLPKDIDRALFSRQVADYPDCTAQQKPRLVKGFADAAQLAQNADGIQQASNA